MEYSHYVLLAEALEDADKLALLKKDVALILENVPFEVELCGKDIDALPFIGDEGIIIGDKKSSHDLGTLAIPFRYKSGDSLPLVMVNTMKLPYDVVIGAVLLSLKHHFPSVTLTTDGGADDWKSAMGLYRYSTDREPPVPYFKVSTIGC
jgi:hypothetical protein